MAPIIDILARMVDHGLEICQQNGVMPAGHNGLYRDPETPVRNTGHWLCIFKRHHDFTKEPRSRDAVARLAPYLISNAARPHGYTFYHRQKEGKDRTNGVIGAAWTFEALHAASELLEDETYRTCARQVFRSIPFHHRYGLWYRLDLDGTRGPIDATFNHQLWLAASAAYLIDPRYPEIGQRVSRFMERLPRNLTVLRSGLIYHPIQWFVRRYPRAILKRVWTTIQGHLALRYQPSLIHKSVGYQSFNLHGFAMLKQSMSHHPFWTTETVARAVTYVLTDQYKHLMNRNEFGFPYNPPGFELPFALKVLGGLPADRYHREASGWLTEQIRRSYDPRTHQFDRNTPDPLTHTARFYELLRLDRDTLERLEVDLPAT
jgi:hypothetical protein